MFLWLSIMITVIGIGVFLKADLDDTVGAIVITTALTSEQLKDIVEGLESDKE